jgi:Holliday junction DNA helicase RuvB
MSRFVVLAVPEYTFEEFMKIAAKRLAEEKNDKFTAYFIAEKVWNELGSRDIRDVIKIARLSDNIDNVSVVVDIVKRHRTIH